MKTVDPKFEHVPFGGKLIIFSGDFRQKLPEVFDKVIFLETNQMLRLEDEHAW